MGPSDIGVRRASRCRFTWLEAVLLGPFPYLKDIKAFKAFPVLSTQQSASKALFATRWMPHRRSCPDTRHDSETSQSPLPHLGRSTSKSGSLQMQPSRGGRCLMLLLAPPMRASCMYRSRFVSLFPVVIITGS
jgi:hypothetical protein